MHITPTTIGLICDMVGIVILFFNGPPAFPVLPDGSEFLWVESDPKENKTKQAKRKDNLSKLALLLIFVGFLLQLIGSFN